MEKLKAYLKSPCDQTLDALWEDSGSLFWVDWRDYDDAIVQYADGYLEDGDTVSAQVRDSSLERGFDMVITMGDKQVTVPYADSHADRDTTLIALSSILAPKYQLRWFMETLGGDTLAFCLLPAAAWEELEQEYTKPVVDFYFQPVAPDLKMFELSVDEVWDLLEARREQNPTAQHG